MASRGGKAKKSSNAVAPRAWISKDSSGKDTDGASLTTVQLWWKEFEGDCKTKASSSSEEKPSFEASNDPKDHWYGVSTGYWDKVEATDDGMLGGFASITGTDLVGSLKFLLPMVQGKDPSFKGKVGTAKAIDIGAGIGRITKGLLSKVFEKTDLMEQNATFLEQCKTEVPTEKAGAFYCAPLQEFEFEGAPYNCIWIQWVLLYLIDVDLIALLKRAKKALAPNGVIVIKENHTRSGFFIDKSDNSITRSDSHFKSIFEAAGLKLIKEENQTDFPRELFPVTMYALV